MTKNPILDELVYDRTSGSLSYKGVRYLLIRPETIAGFQRALFELYGEEISSRLFQGGFTGGRLSAKKYRDIHGDSDQEIIDFMMKMGNQIGWGHFSLDKYDPDLKYLGVVVEHSPFAEAYGDSPHAVCHIVRGVIAGLASVLFGDSCTADEFECRARGDDRCRFAAVTGKKLQGKRSEG